MPDRKLIFRFHAYQRMKARRITEDDILNVLRSGETIEDYPDDTPFPSRLVLGWRGPRPIHVVVADNEQDNELVVITVYEAEPGRWSDDYKRRNE